MLTQKSKDGEFDSKLNNIFDIAHANASNMIKISQDKEFLLAQREKGRRGSMLGVDKHLEKMQKMADFRKNASLKRSQQMKKKCEEVEATVQLVSSNESNEFEQEEKASFTVKEVDMQKGNKKRMKVLTPYGKV
ncbi:hypothetical protein AVEN_77944-1 [Araneus ventricosus]|uniref:Uncharacterized protein n=1 Tax=Araneus ventricosus TaxID=182803 RepID=A0A4Y2DT60_ARAVE|nr:hypothetical protein AVEN_77944-1 [Araneus ventricosus]